MSCRCLPKQPASYGISILREAFKSLSDAPDPDTAFSELDETDWICPKGSPASVSQGIKRKRDKEKQGMASLSSPLFQKKECQVTISRLVMGPGNTYCCDPHASPVAPKEPAGQAKAVEEARQKPPTKPASPQFSRYGVTLLLGSVFIAFIP